MPSTQVENERYTLYRTPDADCLPQNPYLLLTPGPLSTTKGVKAVMLQDWCTWDDDYNQIVEHIRQRLVRLATRQTGYTSVLMQGSGTFSVESVISSAVEQNGILLVLANGAYGKRMTRIARCNSIDVIEHDSSEIHPPDLKRLEDCLATTPQITHVAVVHCETTTGMLNPIRDIGAIAKTHGKTFIVDAMSSFGGIPLDITQIGADFLISSANKCIQGVPGFGFIIVKTSELKKLKGRARSLSLDLFDQWEVMEQHKGKWRFTSPTHTVRAFARALAELDDEGGVAQRYKRYRQNQTLLRDGMRQLGFECLLPDHLQSPIITAFLSPTHPDYEFKTFYQRLKKRGFVIYPGKVTDIDTFRIGNIGHVHKKDIERLITAVEESMFWIG